jgi:hypothetical protein
MRKDDALHACSSVGLDLERSTWGGTAWLFGSRAAGCAMSQSDWDIVILSPLATTSSHSNHGNVDLVIVKWSSDAARSWLASELAVHVAEYGRIIAGAEERDWSVDRVEAYRSKLKRIRSRAVAVAGAWNNLSAMHRARWALAIRRDIQRTVSLGVCGSVPPTFILDQAWTRASGAERLRTIMNVAPVDSGEFIAAVGAAEWFGGSR